MGTLAAVMTGKGTGAIATVALFGPDAAAILNNLFRPKVETSKPFDIDKVTLGEIYDENNPVDEVVIGCEGPDYFAVHCHGNPLIVADIMKLLQKHGVEPVTAERILTEVSGESNSIAIEAKIAVAFAKKIQAAGIIIYQRSKGLSPTVMDWLNNSDTKQIKKQAEDILALSAAVKPLLFGAKIVLIGPPNSGKSTLLNCLAGKQKAIVTELEGTTRDWVNAECILGRICAEVIDTAGIDEHLFSDSEAVEKTAQQNAKELLAAADLIFLVLDASIEAQETLDFFDEILVGKKTMTVLNKTDLPVRFDASELPQNLKEAASISAKFSKGCDGLIDKIEQMLGVTQFDYKKPICFTDRQEQLLQQIISSKTKEQTISAISELLNGKLRV
jgi:tRNA modification GTPase